MGDGAKQHSPITGGALSRDLKSLLSISRTKRSVFLTYAFLFSFILFTLFLAFNHNSPTSSSSAIFFSNIFFGIKTTTKNSSTLSFSDGSQFPSMVSYSLPNSSTFHVNNSIFLSSPIETKSSQNTTNLQQESLTVKTTQILNSKLNDKAEIFTPNSTIIESPKVKNQTQGKNFTDPVLILKPYPMELNRTVNSTQIVTGVGDKRAVEKGVVTDLTSSLLKKSKEPFSGVPAAKSETEKMMEELMNCDLFDGKWVKDDTYPLYKPGSCSLIDEQFNCFQNGRPDQEFQQYKWKPHGCTLPRLDGRHMLELLRGKRLVFVGDSLNRNMWESLVCILRNSVKDQNKVYEASGKKHFRSDPSFSFVFKDYNCTVEFFVSPFLVQEWEMKGKDGLKHETLRIDRMWISADKFKNADILIFNTGHWWTHPKTSQGKDYYQEGTRVYPELNVMEAFRKALTTWLRWLDGNVNPMKSSVFFRGYSASHFSGGQWNSGGQCDNESEPIKNDKYLSQYPQMMIVLEQVLQNAKTPVSYMNITRLTDYRKDGHPSMFRKQHMSSKEKQLQFQDCSHWCLPGVPDLWNELLYAELLVKQYQKQQQQQQKKIP